MEYFNKYVSNTLAGTSPQHFFSTDGEKQTGRIFYKLFDRKKYNYSFLFSNIVDSTFADGSASHCNLICDSWDIYEMNVYQCGDFDGENMPQLYNKQELTFNGSEGKTAAPGEFFSTDEITIDSHDYEYICIELVFSGNVIPYHEECIIPEFKQINGEWQLSKQIPIPSMIGCDKKADMRIAFLGDSITQGIGTEFNSYEHWCSKLAQKLGDNYSFWNIGIGFGRASDAASDGSWLFKAKHMDLVFVCFGVNDILQGSSAEMLKKNLERIVDLLNKSNAKVILQTVPPFDYDEEHTVMWNDVNNYIKTELSPNVLTIFDNNPVLRLSEDKPNCAKYGGHPNAEGCSLWADALYDGVKKFF